MLRPIPSVLGLNAMDCCLNTLVGWTEVVDTQDRRDGDEPENPPLRADTPNGRAENARKSLITFCLSKLTLLRLSKRSDIELTDVQLSWLGHQDL